MSGVGSCETGLDSLFRLETGWSRVRALPRPISQVGWSAETTLSVCLSVSALGGIRLGELSSMSTTGNLIALLLLAICAFLWMRSMWHQYQYTERYGP